MKQETTSRIAALRDKMQQAGIAAVIIPQNDPHMSEYLADHWQARRWLSGFTGSAGSLVVTASKALLWTDSRYFLQAAQQLDGSEIVLMKEGLPETPSIETYLSENLPAGSTVGIDGMVFSTAQTAAMKSEFSRHGIALVTDFDVLDLIWVDRPALPQGKIFIHDEKYAGKSAADKLGAVMANVTASGASSAFISALDEIAWILNIRCNDVRCNPVTTSFLYISADRAILFVDPAKLTADVSAYLTSQGVTTEPYADMKHFLASLAADATVLVEPSRTAASIVDILGRRAVTGNSPVALLKSCKNDIQIAGIREAMKRDGAALVSAVMDIESAMATGATLTEIDVDRLLHKYRSQSPMWRDESFGTIAGYGPHGAIVHYEATDESNATVKPCGLLLIDSGAQYLDGTTDITRTIAVGEPTELERRDFTLVMKGHIALAQMIFPAGTTGHQLDAIARQYLWKNGLSYLHGTGHGVGHFLNVHEGPQSIRLNYVPTPLMPGMITSNEPGLYREGVHGIRCENLVLTIPAMATEFGQFLKFETLTLFPFDLKLFDTSIMTDDEIAWVNAYHAKVRETLLPALDTDERRNWLTSKTQPLTR